MIHDFEESPEITPDMSFGQVVRKIRRSMGMNQTDFGDYVGVDQHTISDYETGKKYPNLLLANVLLRRIGCRLTIERVANED